MYFQNWMIPNLLLLVQTLLVVTQGTPLREYQTGYSTHPPNKGDAIDWEDDMSEERPLHPGRLVEPVVFEPK